MITILIAAAPTAPVISPPLIAPPAPLAPPVGAVALFVPNIQLLLAIIIIVVAVALGYAIYKTRKPAVNAGTQERKAKIRRIRRELEK